MTLSAGTRLGPYEILSPLGAGGMGGGLPRAGSEARSGRRVLSAHMGMIPPLAAVTSARKALETAKALQGESAEGLHAEAFASFLERRWDAMESA